MDSERRSFRGNVYQSRRRLESLVDTEWFTRMEANDDFYIFLTRAFLIDPAPNGCAGITKTSDKEEKTLMRESAQERMLFLTSV